MMGLNGLKIRDQPKTTTTTTKRDRMKDRSKLYIGAARRRRRRENISINPLNNNNKKKNKKITRKCWLVKMKLMKKYAMHFISIIEMDKYLKEKNMFN